MSAWRHARARGRLEELLPSARIEALAAGLGASADLPRAQATVITLGSVLMPNARCKKYQLRSLVDGVVRAVPKRQLRSIEALSTELNALRARPCAT